MRSAASVRICGLVAALVFVAGTPLRAQFPAELAGRVVDARTRAPVEGARVRVGPAGFAAESDAAGRFHLKGLPAGDWDVGVTSIGYRAARLRVTLVDGQVERAEVMLQPAAFELATLEVVAPRTPAGPGISVISREQIEATLAPDVSALLLGQPGVTVTRRGGPGSPASVSIRGSDPRQVLVLLDDVPLNDPTTGEVDLASLPIEQIERITIVRGAAASRYGARALAGAVAIERKRPTQTDGSLTLQGGAWGERTARGSGSLVRERGGRVLAGSLSGGFSRFEGDFGYPIPEIRGGGSARRANGDGRTASLLGSVRYGGPRSLVELRGDYLDVDRGLPGSVIQPTLGARQDERRFGGGVSGRVAAGGLDWRASVDASDGEVRYADPDPPAAPPYRDSVQVRQLQADLEASRAFGPARVSVGGEARWLNVRASSLVEGAPETARVTSGWVQANAEPVVGRTTLTLSAGARVDRDVRRDDTRISPSLALGVPLPGATMQISWAMAFAPPTLADQFFQPGVLARPNPDLGAERVRNDWQLQVTSKTFDWGGVTANGSVSLFRADVDGMVLWFPDFRFIWSPDNYDVRRRGAEVGATVTVPWADLSLTGGLSAAAVEYRGPVLSGQVAYRPRYTGNAALSASAFGLRPTLRYRYVGRRRTIPGSELNTLPPFSVVDLQVSRPVALAGAAVEVALGLDDVFDRAGTMLLDYPAPGRTWRFAVTVRGRRAQSPTP